MKFLITKIFTFMFCLFSLALHAEGEIRDSSSGTSFPRDISFDDNGKTIHLQATGMAVRKKFFVKVYSMAHYLQDGASVRQGNVLQEIMNDNRAKQITMKWLHEASAEKQKEGYMETFRKVLTENEFDQLQSDINQFISYFNQDAKKGDEYIIRWLPGGKIELMMNGKRVGSLKDKNFAKALWSIWFGDKSVVNRDNLISLVQ